MILVFLTMVTETLQTNTAHWELISECIWDCSSWPKRSGVYGWLVSSPTSQDLSTWLQGQGRRASRLEDFAAAQTNTFLTWEASGFWLSSTLHVGPVKCGFLIRTECSKKGVWDSGINISAKPHVPRGFPNYTLLAHVGLQEMLVEWKNSCTTQQLSSMVRKVETIWQRMGDFFCQRSESKYFQLCRPYCLCHNYSVLPLSCESFYKTLFTKKGQWTGSGLWHCTLWVSLVTQW